VTKIWWYPPFPAMRERPETLPARQTLLLILLPMLGTFVLLRLYLHLMGVRHIYPGGHLVHHLYLGVLIVIPAAFLLAFPCASHTVACLTRVAVGIGSGLALDEVTYLVMTQASDKDYVSRVSLFGAGGFISLAVILLLALFLAHRD
jgi:hypothetical protein